MVKQGAKTEYNNTSDERVAASAAMYVKHQNATRAARALGISRTLLYRHLIAAVARGMIPKSDVPKAVAAEARTRIRKGHTTGGEANRFFEIDKPPSAIEPIGDILARREREQTRRFRAEKARELINVQVKMDGPIGLIHFGDPHIDDPGTDIVQLRRDIELVKKTPGMFGCNVGDLQNNWVGRLARLYGEQGTSAMEAWALTEWMVREIPWLFIIGGNHDMWSGAGDPLRWIADHKGVLYEGYNARLNLSFPNGKNVRVNARHDFAGHSQWNTAHGPAKAAQMGWRDHILTCGHKHTSGYQILKCPSTGLLSHAIRVAGYKIHDRYGKELGLPNQNITPAVCTIIDPIYEDDDPRLVTTIHDVGEAAEFLTWKRSKRVK